MFDNDNFNKNKALLNDFDNSNLLIGNDTKNKKGKILTKISIGILFTYGVIFFFIKIRQSFFYLCSFIKTK